MANITKKDALDYHETNRPGKIEVIPTTPHSTQRDLALAYSPGVAEPCLEIEKNPEKVYNYTAKGNLVAVISNGTAVLGLGKIGALASKPVMEGKGLLFKTFADIDVFDIELDTTNVEDFIKTVKIMSPTFGGINLEDISAPESFEIEERLIKELDIPVMHDDQHGTAIISAAGLLNALELNGKKIEEIKLVVNGAGAAAISCTKLYKSLGVKPENIVMIDINGVLNKNRTDLFEQQLQFVTNRDIETLDQAIEGADVFLGLSAADVLTADMIKKMAKNPIVFALANPNPEISYEKAVSSRNDLYFATGRSDHPNQINNVLGFPYIFRGALDVSATVINEEMKIAAVKAIAQLAKEPVPDEVNIAYNEKSLSFGRDYLIPKPFDQRLLTTVAPAIAKAAIDSGVAKRTITNWDEYRRELRKRIGADNKLLRTLRNKARKNVKRVIITGGNNDKVIKAALEILNDGIAIPVVLGNQEAINKLADENNLNIKNLEIIDFRSDTCKEMRVDFAKDFYKEHMRKGITFDEAKEKMYNSHYFGTMMVKQGIADAFVSCSTKKYITRLEQVIDVIGMRPGLNHVAGMHLMMTKKGPIFFSDTTVNKQPSTELLVNSTLLAANAVRTFNIEPCIAMLSHSNFGATPYGSSKMVKEAVEILHEQHPHILVDGEMQVNFALDPEIRMKKFPFSKLKDREVNVLMFPNVSSGNIAYKLLQNLGETEPIGPILTGLNKSTHILQIGSSVREIVNMITFAAVDAEMYDNNTFEI